MSTKGTLKYQMDDATGQGFHLYEEVFDDENVYLELRGLQFDTSTSFELTGEGPLQVVVKLPSELARSLGLLAPQDKEPRGNNNDPQN